MVSLVAVIACVMLQPALVLKIILETMDAR
ncbi:hypothetical protein FHX77_000695 [Bifidobacterium commune]|nr:hypothetical protein [Bifidobacterium commune]